jgi:hypothetical protein
MKMNLILLQFGITFLLIAAFSAPVVKADPLDQTTYAINFTGAGLNPTAGSFTYDPDTAVFTAFTVMWNTITYDLTSGANSPVFITAFPGCIGGASGGAATFALLSGQCNPPSSPNGDTEWEGAYFPIGPPTSFFNFLSGTSTFSGGGCPCTEIIVSTGPNALHAGAITGQSEGDWTITAVSPVPEPSTLTLLTATLLCAAFVRRKHRKLPWRSSGSKKNSRLSAPCI